jgi:uncharacterized membrane protein
VNAPISLLWVLLALCALMLHCLATSYSVQILDTAAGPLYASAINDNGQIVGLYNPDGTPSCGFLLDRGILTTIDPPGTPANVHLFLNGINNSGVITGIVETGSTNFTDYPFIDDGRNYTFYGPITGFVATTFGSINDDGQILGGSSAGQCSFLYRNGTVAPLSLPGSFTSAEDLDDAGQIVGSYLADAHQHGYLYKNRAYATIDSPISSNTMLVALNSVGQILGQADGYGPGGSLGSFWDDHGTFTAVSPSRDVQFLATDINNLGRVVGIACFPVRPRGCLAYANCSCNRAHARFLAASRWNSSCVEAPEQPVAKVIEVRAMRAGLSL